MILGSKVIPTDEYRAEASSPSQKKGSCFHSLSLESLFQESILPARDCKPVSRQKSYVYKYYTSLFFLRFHRAAKTSKDAFSHSKASVGCNHTTEKLKHTLFSFVLPRETNIPEILTGLQRL